ncbi:MAG: ABC transporter substrate-binding protein [Alphaproteobacteria bacterium]|nr:ABC transporter substrate-binding protein [Alphaproteobacteria bacterium]
MNKKLWIIIAVIAIVAAIALAFSPRRAPMPASDKPVVKIAALYPMSGDAAIYGDASRKVIEAFLSEWESNNPNARYKYEVHFEDVQLSTQKAVTAMQRIALNDEADAIMNILSSISLAINPITDKYRIININYTLDPATSSGDYAFRLATDVKLAIGKLVSRLQNQGVKKIALVASNDVSGNILYEEIIRQMKAQDKVALGPTFRINPGEKNFDVIIQKIKQSDADMLILEALPPESDLFFIAMKRNNLRIPATAYQTLGTLKDKSLAEGMWEINDVSASPEWIEKYSKVLGGTDTYYSDATYTMLNVLINAWEKADTEPGQRPTKESVVKSMKKNTAGLKTPLGTLQTDEEGDILMSIVVREIQNGIPVVIKE